MSKQISNALKQLQIAGVISPVSPLVKPVNCEECNDQDDTCQECCPHDEHDHGICMDCGKDRTDVFVGAAEAHFEGDR